MNWTDPASGELIKGFREMGFLPEAFVNMLALLGWNDGSDQELFSLNELVEKFSIERINNSGAKFDFEKAKWFNHEWIKKLNLEELRSHFIAILAEHQIFEIDNDYLDIVINLVKERLILLVDFWDQASFFFKEPETYDLASVLPKWTAEKTAFFTDIIEKFEGYEPWSSEGIETLYKLVIQASGLKMGELMLPFRIMLVGGKFGPHIFDIAATLGREESIKRIKKGLSAILTQ